MAANTPVAADKAAALKPGAQDTSTVQLATGNISFPIHLFSLAGRNGLDFTLTITYSNGGVHKVVDTWNLDAPTGVLGLGWSLPTEAIVRNTNATADPSDDVYYLFTAGNMYPLFKTASTVEGDLYACENYNFWKICYRRNRELWTVTRENGDCYSYGGELPASAAGFRSSSGHSIEWGVKWNNWIGISNVAVGQAQFPMVWNLASIGNMWNERVSFEYEQVQPLAGALASQLQRPFTKACRLRRVIGASGETIVFTYKEKRPEEYQRQQGPPAEARDTCQIVGELSAQGGWDPVDAAPDPRLRLTVTGKDGFSKTFVKDAKTTAQLAFTFDLPLNAPDTLDIAFNAEDVDPGDNDPLLSGSFTDVAANAGIVQKDSKQGRRVATLKLSYVKEHLPPAGDADIYQARQENQYLTHLELYSAEGVKTEQIELGYGCLGMGATLKRVLTSITHMIRASNGSYRPTGPGHLFEYHGQAQEDGVSGVSVATSVVYANEDVGAFTTTRYDYQLFNPSTGALFGALKSCTSPEGAKTSYRYQELSIQQARRDREIRRPQDDSAAWQSPQAYFGSDYVVVIWKGSGVKSGLLHATVYQWCGHWAATELGELPNGATGTLYVECAADFFAIVTPKQAPSVHLFSQNKLRPGQWEKVAPDYMSSAEVAVASGRHFVALLDKPSGQLVRFTRDGRTWRTDPHEQSSGGSGAVLALAARGNYIFTASATPDNTSPPELRLYTLDELMHWRVSTLRLTEHFFEQQGYEWTADYGGGAWNLKSYGTKALELYASNTFVVLQAVGSVAHYTNIFGSEELFEVYRHFIYRWTEDSARIQLDFEPCLDISKGTQWDCIKRHNTELVIEKGRGLVRPSVVGDQVLIDVWEDIALTDKAAWTPKQQKFAYQYSGNGWYERIFSNDRLENNYIGLHSFSTTENGDARHWEFNPGAQGWQPSNLPTYKDGNASRFEKVVWPIIQLVGGIVTLPLDLGPGLLIDIFFLNIDALISAMTKLGGTGQGTNEFFCADFTRSDLRQNNLLYHRSSTGRWEAVGDLTPDIYMGQETGQKLGTQTVLEDLKLDYRSTQYVENAIIYTLELERYGVMGHLGLLQRGHGTLPGYPHYTSRIQLVKNGVFLKTVELAEGELVRQRADDARLSGQNAFISFKGGESLHEASALKLYRVINDDIQGPLTDFVVSQVTVHDGYSETHTHYSYDTASASVVPTGTGALYSKVTTTYSGASLVADKRNGFSESLFHDERSALYKGRLYQTTIFNHEGAAVATNTWRWQAFEKELMARAAGAPERSRKGYFVRAIAAASNVDGATKLTETDYCTEDVLEFEIKSGDRLPLVIAGHNWGVEIKGTDGWYIDPNARLGVSKRGSSTGAEPWQPQIGPLSLDSNLSGTLQFRYEVSTSIDARGTAIFEAWVDGAKIWSDERSVTEGGFTQVAALSLAFDHGPLELRVTCRLYGLDLDLHVSIYHIGMRPTVIGTPTEVRTVHYDAAGTPVRVVNAYGYGWQKYPALLAQNILTPVVATSTRVNEIVTAASTTTWQPAEHADAGADAVVQRWAPVATYQAQRSTGRFDFAQPEHNTDWIASSTVLVRTPRYGLVAETQDVDGLVHSVLYDKQYRFPVASCVHASVERSEAGYYGFEDYEQSERWQIDGTRQPDAYTGVAALAGNMARIEPKSFAPRSAQTSYIVSAWLKPRSGGSGGQIGFGSHTTTIAAGSDTWQYVEFISATPHANQKPFASCDGAIDDFRFGPLDAPFEATVYDPVYHHVTAKLASNEGALRMVYDHLRRPLATLGPDAQILSLRSERFSREGEQAFDAGQPNQTLTILPRNGGRYYRTFAEFTRTIADHQRADRAGQGSNKGLRFRLVAPTNANAGGSSTISDPDEAAVPRSAFTVRFGPIAISGSIAWEAAGARGDLILGWPDSTPVTGAPGLSVPVGSDAHYRALTDCTLVLLLLDGYVYCFIGGTLRASQALPAAAGGELSLEWAPVGDAGLEDLLIFYDPIVDLSFSDGLGRVIQTQHMADKGPEALAVQTLYNGWGHAALQTKPVPVTQGLAYQHDLVSAFDWASGVMSGRVVDYYGRTDRRAADQQANDHQYPYVRRVAESSPLARIVEIGAPGSEFKPGAPHAIRHAFGQTAQATALLTDLGLSKMSQHYTALTTQRALDTTRQTTAVQIFDLQGKPIARRQGSGAGAVTSSYGVQYTLGETVATSKLPNAFASADSQTKDRYVQTSVTNFRGLLKQSSDCDRGAQHYIHDRAGRLRFRLDAAGAAEHPHRLLYWKYDALGRVIEEGWMLWNWNEGELQAVAESDPTWPHTLPSWPMYGHDSRNSRQCPVTVAAPKASHPDSDLDGIEYRNLLEEAPSSILESQIFAGSSGRLFFIDRNVTQGLCLAVVDPRTGIKQRLGDPVAGMDIGGRRVNNSRLIVLTADETVYFLSGSGELCCLKSGEKNPRKISIDGDSPTPERTLSLGPDQCIYLTSDKDLVVVEPDGRKRRHEHIRSTPAPKQPTWSGQLPAIAEDGTVVRVIENDVAWLTGGKTMCYLLRIGPDGSQQQIKLCELDWQHRLERVVPLMIAPSGTVYVYLRDVIFAFQGDKQIWGRGVKDVNDMALGADGTVYFLAVNRYSHTGWINALDGRTGRQTWSREVTFSNFTDSSHLVVGGDGMLYCAHGRELMAFAPSNGDLKWSVRDLLNICYPLSISSDGLLLAPTPSGFYSIGTRSASASATWRKRYFYDTSPNGSANVYQHLEQLLTAAAQGETAKWREADEETWNVLLKVTNREKEGDWLNAQDGKNSLDAHVINTIPCADLKKIDQLWQTYSGGKFGFGVQTRIWQACNGSTGYLGRNSFGQAIGWYRNDMWIRPAGIQYHLSAPAGHLPAIGVFRILSCDDWSVALSGLHALFTRVQACEEPQDQPHNLQGRLSRVVSRGEDGNEIEETYQYDLYGRVRAVSLRASAFDDRIRTTTYTYDTQGNVVEIGYPASRDGTTSIGAVRYGYTSGGRIASIGTATDPTFYAAYEYNIDGSVRTERLNRQRLQRDYRYDFQGRLVSIVDRDPGQQVLFAETLSYRDASGGFKDGHIAQASFTGSALSLPHRYDYEYDEQGRLLAARAASLSPQAALPEDRNVEGVDGKPIGYDANGNLVTITQQGIAREYFYEPGTNRLAASEQPRQAQVFSFEPHEEARFHPGGTHITQFEENHWYCKGLNDREFRLTDREKHSGTRSLQLGYVLTSRLTATPRAARYVFRAWVKNSMPDTSRSVHMAICHAGSGERLVTQDIKPTGGEWRRFECVLEHNDVGANRVLEAQLDNQVGWLDPRYPVYVDDVCFGIEASDYRYDANGCVTSSGPLSELRYDPLTWLAHEIRTDPQSSDVQSTRVVKLRYGARRQRVLKTVSSHEERSSAGARTIHDKTQHTLYLHGTNAYPLSEARKGSWTEVVDTENPSGTGSGWQGWAAYVYGLGGLIAMHEGDNSYFFCKDHLGSTRIVLDQDSHVHATFDYLPFGKLIAHGSPPSQGAEGFRYLYTGQEYDWETGLYNYRARMYDSGLARFYAPDPAYQYASPYVYVGNNPINFVDPTGASAAGLALELLVNAGIGGVIGAGIGGVEGGIAIHYGDAQHKSDREKTEMVFTAMGIGLAAGAVGGSVASLVDRGINRLMVRNWWHTYERTWAAAEIRGWGAVKGGLSGGLGGFAGQITANSIDAARGEKVDWGTSISLAVGIGSFTGVLGGTIGATRMRSGEYYVQSDAPAGQRGRYHVYAESNYPVHAPGRDWRSAAETFGERFGSPIGGGLGLLGDLANVAINTWALPQNTQTTGSSQNTQTTGSSQTPPGKPGA